VLSILLSSQCLALAILLWVITGACVGRRRAYKYRDWNLFLEKPNTPTSSILRYSLLSLLLLVLSLDHDVGV